MIRLLVVIALLATPALAQQPPSPEMQALGQKLMQEINANVQCTANAIAGRAEIDKLKAEIEALKKEKGDAK